MNIHFYLRYHTEFGEACLLSIDGQTPQTLNYLNDDFWHGIVDIDPKKHKTLRYGYLFQDKNGDQTAEWEQDRVLELSRMPFDHLQVVDTWNPAGAVENAFYTQPFQTTFLKASEAKPAKAPAGFSHEFRIKAPLLQSDEVLCLLGHGVGLRNWDTTAPVLLQREGAWWVARIEIPETDFPLGYKYGVWNTRTNRFQGFEQGSNRTLYARAKGGTLIHDGFARFPNNTWRGAGVAIPVFSLRTRNSWGVGEFTDLHALVDWARSTGLKLIQLLPVNDTTATHTWTDSYPYAAISAFALHPLFLNLERLAGKKHAAILKPWAKQQKALNNTDAVDYEAVMTVKWEAVKTLYPLMKADWLADKAYQAYLDANRHWLAPYAAFCYLRDQNGTSDFNQWRTHKVYKAKDVEKLLAPDAKTFDEVAIHLFVQWHLHLQLKAAADYAHSNGLVVKGDIPIGIYRYSCDAWVEPELYNMNQQAGAPPDDFAENGQNWGFPTYNWARMQADGFAWWRRRFEQMSLYFDAFRIDHILGFFRIWSIPLDAVQGILGRFVPAIPVQEQEFHERGVGFNYQRFCTPYITERVLWEVCGDDAPLVKEQFLEPSADGRLQPRTAFASQRLVEAWYEKQDATPLHARLCEYMYTLLANVILIPDGEQPNAYHFRFGIDKTASFRHLDPIVQQRLNDLYVNYFFRRQDDFWQQEAMEKLPALKRGTNMLICGEDLGMVPHCVPDVMEELGILSLEIQRMPKKAGSTFFHPKDAPYLSVVTPSTHDMSIIRGWWEEDQALSQRFYNEILLQPGQAPFFCEPWINRMILEQHFHSPAMWSIFQLQDLMGMDGVLRRENPNDERINIPAIPKHYWRYRMHISLEALQELEGFNQEIRRMVGESGRG